MLTKFDTLVKWHLRNSKLLFIIIIITIKS